MSNLLVAPCRQPVAPLNENCDGTAAPIPVFTDGVALVWLCCTTNAAEVAVTIKNTRALTV